jgi:hypothetical protein
MAFEPAITCDVLYGEATSDEMSRDQDRPVALQGISLCTHQGDPVLLDAVVDSPETSLKMFSASKTVILNSAVDVATRILRARPKLLPEENIGNPADQQRAL